MSSEIAEDEFAMWLSGCNGMEHLKKRAFLVAFAQSGQIERSAKQAEVSRTTVWRWRRDDPKFSEAFDVAKMCACDLLLDAAFMRATGQVNRLVFNNGTAVIDPRTGTPYEESVQSDVLLIFLLKKLMPERFGDEAGRPASANEIRVVFDDNYSSNPNYAANSSKIVDDPPAMLPCVPVPEPQPTRLAG